MLPTSHDRKSKMTQSAPAPAFSQRLNTHKGRDHATDKPRSSGVIPVSPIPSRAASPRRLFRGARLSLSSESASRCVVQGHRNSP